MCYAALVTTSLRAHYESRAEQLKGALAELEARSDALSRRRGLVMLALGGSLVFAWMRGFPPWGWIGPGACTMLFAWLVVRHAIVASERTLLEERESYVRAGQRRLAGEPEPSALLASPKLDEPDGSRFEKPEHPNAADLDLFGPRSLFIALSRAETSIGEETLARWLLTPARVSEVKERQEAAKELLGQPSFLEDLSVFAQRADSRGRTDEPLALWGESPAEFPVGEATTPLLQKRRLLVIAARLLVPLTIVLFFTRAYLETLAPHLGKLWVASFLGQLAVLAALHGAIARMVTFVSSREAPFGRFRAVFGRIEAVQLKSPPLSRIVSTVKDGESLASQEIGRLERIIGFADVRHNTIIHILLNMAFLYDVWVALALERWRSRSGRRTRPWLTALGEMEALASIATYAGEHPDFAWPELEEGPKRLVAEGLGHPLIPASSCVANDAQLPEPGQALLVTGSNMSGKSTYLRSLGLCAVMANAGLPVCAKRAQLTPLIAWTSMRISDDLDQGMSHFYAELLRLKAIVDAVHSGAPVLFLLDEILHGTNSRERTIGARGVVLDLVRRGAIGAVSTHDFALIAIADESGGRVKTVHFSDRIEHDKMLFDYLLKDGVVQSTNAIRLMKLVGIDVEYNVGES